METTLPSPDAASTPQPVLLVNERTAARMLAISERSLWALRAQGLIRCVRINASIRYRVTDIESFVANLSTVNTSKQ